MRRTQKHSLMFNTVLLQGLEGILNNPNPNETKKHGNVIRDGRFLFLELL